MELAPRCRDALAGGGVIDNPVQVQRQLAQLKAALPVPARATTELAAMLKTQDISNPASAVAFMAVSYAGEEGGIMCRLEIPTNKNDVHVSITQLHFDPQLELAREIAAYQKHRVKHLKRIKP